MEIKEFTGKNVDEALTNACTELGIVSTELNYEVIEKGSSGFLGINAKDAVIRVTLGAPEVKEEPKNEEVKVEKKEVKTEVKVEKKANVVVEDPSDAAKAFLADVFKAMGLDVEITTKFDASSNTLNIELAGPEMGIIIGRGGQTLDSVQYLTNLAINRNSTGYIKVKVDTEDYRRRREETLKNLAKNVAYKVKRTRKSVSLEAMNPNERRIIHSALQNDQYVTTHSEGEEPYRHVVVTLKK